MKVGNYATPTPGDHPEVPESLFALLHPTMDQVETLTTAAQGRLGPENLDWEVRELELSDDTTTQVALQRLRSAPLGCVLLWTALADHGQLHWQPIDRSTISVNVTWASSPTTPVLTRFLVLGA